MRNGENLSAVILAAGFSSRMKEFKPLLMLGGMTLLERTVGLFRDHGTTDVLVVAGHRAHDVSAEARRLGARCIVNEQYERGMFTSVRTAVKNLPPDAPAFFLLPVDIPLVRPHTVRRLVEVWREGSHGILYPSFLGQRGHPPLISRRYIEDIIDWNGAGGLRPVLEKREDDARDVEVADRFILEDMDTPDDFAAMRVWQARAGVPDVDECRSLLTRVYRREDSLVSHCRSVARVALRLGRRLSSRGCGLNLDLLLAAALLHDIAKGQPDHAAAGARMLSNLDFPSVAEVIACHMDLVPPSQGAPDERELLYLADKMVKGSRLVHPEKRFAEAIERYADDASTVVSIERRRRTVEIIENRIGTILGRSGFDLVSDGEEGSDEQGTHLSDEAW